MFPAYPQQQIVSGSSMHNFIPMVTAHPTPYQHGVSLGPILLQPTTNTAMSYVYPLPNPHQISFVNPTTPITSVFTEQFSFIYMIDEILIVFIDIDLSR